jgi:hypothetical protein
MPQSLLSVPNRAAAPPVKGYLWLVPERRKGKNMISSKNFHLPNN